MKKTVVLAVTVLTLSMAGTAVFAAGRGNEFGQNNSVTRMNCGRNCIYTNCGAGFVDENGDGVCDNYGTYGTYGTSKGTGTGSFIDGGRRRYLRQSRKPFGGNAKRTRKTLRMAQITF